VPNSLGSLGGFEVQPPEPGEVYGMRYAGTAAMPASPPTKPGAVPLTGSGHGPALQAELEAKLAARAALDRKRSPEQIAELVRDCERAIARLEKAAASGRPTPELQAQLRNELLNQLLAELMSLESERAKAMLRDLYEPRWVRYISKLDTDRFANVCWVRKLMGELTTRDPEFRRIFEEARIRFPLPDPVCQAEGS